VSRADVLSGKVDIAELLTSADEPVIIIVD
jgi:hypothetical protein